MKKLMVLALALCCYISVHSQVIKNEITLDDIWLNGSFRPDHSEILFR